MLASFSDFDAGHGFFLGLPRPEELLRPAHNRLDISLDGSGILLQNSSGMDGVGKAADGPTSSGSGQDPGRKPSKECQNAQKRFRARQKERMSNLEREVAEKKATFEQLAQENLFLRARTSILEKVVSCRDEQLSMVQAFEERCRTAPNTLSCFGSSSPNTTADGSAGTQETFRTMKKEQVIPQYKAFLAEVSRHLLHCEYPCSDPTKPVVQQVAACVERMGHVLKHLLLLNGGLMRQLLLINLETGQPGVPTEGHWDGVVAALQLGPEQRGDILAVLALYHGLLAKVYEERKLIRVGLGSISGPCGGGLADSGAGAGPGPSAAAGSSPSDPSGSGSLQQQQQLLDSSAISFGVSRPDLAVEMELSERLHANLAKEQGAHTLLSCFFFGKVLEPPQFAKVAVYSYPFFPDCLAVANAVARLAGGGEPHQHHLQHLVAGPGLARRPGGGGGGSGSFDSRSHHHHRHQQ